MLEFLKIRKLERKLIQNFMTVISDEFKFIHFLEKNNFALDITNELIIFYKYGVVDNTTLTYKDDDDIKTIYKKEFLSAFNGFVNKFNMNISDYYTVIVDICNYDHLKYSTINLLSSGKEFDINQIIDLTKTNLIENAEISDKLDNKQIYIYKIEYTLKDINKYLKARKQYKRFGWLIFLTLLLLTILTYLIK